MGDRWHSRILAVALGIGAISAGLMYTLGRPSATARGRTGPPSLEEATLNAYRDKPGDPDLGELFAQLNVLHFEGRLPAVKVIWAGDLDRHDIGDSRLNGMTDGSIILLKTALEADRAETRQTLCHEMVHVKFIAGGERSTAHGERFQQELRRLLDEGCFHAIWSSPEEQDALKRRIETERRRLESVREHLDAQGASIGRETERIERLFSDLNERIRTANRTGAGAPSPEEIASAEQQQAALNQSILVHNAAVAAHASDQARFNEDVERYNLMLAYPDGLAEDRAKGLIR